MTERPVNLPPEFTKMKHYSEKGGHKARSDAQKDKKAFNKAFPEPRLQKPRHQKKMVSPEFKLKAVRHLTEQEHRTSGYTEGFLAGMEFSMSGKEKAKMRKKVNHNLNNVQKLLNGSMMEASDETQEKLMEIHSVVEAMKSKPKIIYEAKKERK